MAKGVVTIFNNVKGFGFIRGGTLRVFFHEKVIRGVTGFRTLSLGAEVEYDLDLESVNRLQADLVELCGPVTVATQDTPPLRLRGGIVDLFVDRDDGDVYVVRAAGELADPSVVAETFSAYYTGGEIVKGFSMTLPPSSEERIYLFLDADTKVPLEEPEEGGFECLPLGTYLLEATSGGEVKIFTFGRRFQQEGNHRHNWAVVEVRFHHTYDFSPEAAPIAEQTPSSGLDRDNDGFVPSIEVARAISRSLKAGGSEPHE